MEVVARGRGMVNNSGRRESGGQGKVDGWRTRQ